MRRHHGFRRTATSMRAGRTAPAPLPPPPMSSGGDVSGKIAAKYPGSGKSLVEMSNRVAKLNSTALAAVPTTTEEEVRK